MSENIQVQNQIQTETKAKPRKWYLALLASLAVPGLGQMYNGQLAKGIVFGLIMVSLSFVFVFFRTMITFQGLILNLIPLFGFWLYTIIDSIYTTVRQQNYHIKIYNRWYYYLPVILIVFTVSTLQDNQQPLGVKTFRSIDDSGLPTIHKYDCLVADLRAYENKTPDYGEIVVFKMDEKTFLFGRIVGLPNDTIEYKTDTLKINGILCTSEFIKSVNYNNIPMHEKKETLPNRHKHRNYYDEMSINYHLPSDTLFTIIVPSNEYFLMGDNRNFSIDSRQFGTVNEDRIIGRVLYSYWGESLNRIGIEFTNR